MINFLFFVVMEKNSKITNEIAALKRGFDKANERFASSILSSIVGYYLNYNKCDRTLRSKLCSLCEIQERQVLIENKRKQLN